MKKNMQNISVRIVKTNTDEIFSEKHKKFSETKALIVCYPYLDPY